MPLSLVEAQVLVLCLLGFEFDCVVVSVLARNGGSWAVEAPFSVPSVWKGLGSGGSNSEEATWLHGLRHP